MLRKKINLYHFNVTLLFLFICIGIKTSWAIDPRLQQFVKKNKAILASAEGDLNGDGLFDAALVLHNPKAQFSGKSDERELLLLLQNKEGKFYEVIRNKKAIQPVLFLEEPLYSLEILPSHILSFSFVNGAVGGLTHQKYQFKYMKENKWQLVNRQELQLSRSDLQEEIICEQKEKDLNPPVFLNEFQYNMPCKK